jgi:hypothetical protein
MIDHDPLCRWDETSAYPCDCAVIRRSRADALANNSSNSALESSPVDTAYRLGRLDAAAAIDELSPSYIEGEWRVRYVDAIAAARGPA